MRQQTLASQASFERYGRKSRRELFLEEMDRVVPCAELEAFSGAALRQGRQRTTTGRLGNHASDLLRAAVV
jgi:hypothetical protein